MSNHSIIINKLQGYSGIRLLNDNSLEIKPGVNLIVGRNGSGKSNLISLINSLSTEDPDIGQRVESAFFKKCTKDALRKTDEGYVKNFGLIDIAEFSFNNEQGTLSISLKDTHEKYVMENILQQGSKFEGFIQTHKSGVNLKMKHVNQGGSVLKLDFGGSLHSNVLSINRSNKDLSNVIQGPIEVINQFVHERVLDFFESDEFRQKIAKLESTINKKLQSFFGSTNKKVKLILNARHYLDVTPVLIDGENEIQPEYISSGESALLDLIFTLASLNMEEYDVIAFDEPERHMHDDMISVLIQEIMEISQKNQKCKILIATHSTSLIETLAKYGTSKINLITFDRERQVSNSNSDIDLINALSRNGVTFSPLMLSRKLNIFIENLGKQAFNHRNFLIKFFDHDNQPNIIPIGTSGNVQDSISFISVFEDIMKASNAKSVGIQDGDIWIKKHLISYLSGDINLSLFIDLIQKQNEPLIKGVSDNQFLFNCWEIENLYLLPETLKFWIKGSDRLSMSSYKNILQSMLETFINQFLGTYYKKIAHIRVEYQKADRILRKIERKLSSISSEIQQNGIIEKRSIELIKYLIENNLWHWLPGKEIYKCLRNKGYSFNDSNLDYQSLVIGQQIRKILKV